MDRFLVFMVVCFIMGSEPEAMASDLHEDLIAAREELRLLDHSVPFQTLNLLKRTPQGREIEQLSPSLRVAYSKRRSLREKIWGMERALVLSRAIQELSPSDPLGPFARSRRAAEAESIAREAVPAFAELRRRYEMLRPPVLQNILVNMGIKKEGFCWHWTRDLFKRLRPLDLREYELLWATAHEGTLREHNTLVIVPRGSSLEKGLLLDGWRKSGTPFWVRVVGDRYPWQPGSFEGDESELEGEK